MKFLVTILGKNYLLKTWISNGYHYNITSYIIWIGFIRAEKCPFTDQIDEDLAPFSDGISEDSIQNLKSMSNLIHYQIISGAVYRTEYCQVG